jgi:anaerobic magnesium-protoporphyrin IX monomethyl ester cyclase
MKIALIQHKYAVPIDDPCIYPLGFMYISAVLKQNGHDVTVFNENLYQFPEIPYREYDAVLMTGFEEFLPKIKVEAALCKDYGVKTILGGALAAYKPQEMLEYVDVVIVGEGEQVINQALHSLGEIRGTKPNLDTLPLPDYDGFGIDEYHARHEYRYMGVLASRGCPHNCKFCAQTCCFQFRNLDGVFEEIDLYNSKYDVDVIIFNDNTLNLRKDRFLDICEGMEKRGILWSAAIRCDNFDEEMAMAAKKAGAIYFVVGVESFSQKRLDAMNKHLKVSDIYNTLTLLNKYNIDYHGNILMGLPGDTPETIIGELNSMPKRFNVFPCFVQGFVGTALAGQDNLNKDQRKAFAMLFKQYIERNGKYMYPELRAA